MSSDEIINYLGSSKAHSQFFLPFKVNLSKITQCCPSWCGGSDLQYYCASGITFMTVYLCFTLIYAFRSTAHCLWNLFGSDVSSSRICVFLFPRYSLHVLFIFTLKVKFIICNVFYTEWRKDPLTQETTN